MKIWLKSQIKIKLLSAGVNIKSWKKVAIAPVIAAAAN
jgi:hypothetical protein